MTMDDQKGWLKKILNDASEDVKTWPNWLRDPGSAHESHESGCSRQETETDGADLAEGDQGEKSRREKRALRRFGASPE